MTLEALCEGMPGITRSVGTAHVEACLVCLDRNAHHSGVALQLSGTVATETIPVLWDMPLTDQIRRAHADPQDATEAGACGIAFLLAVRFTPYTVIERAYKGTGFDYWLGEDDAPEIDPKARLEVSGMFNAGTVSKFNTRVKQKLDQTHPTDELGLPAYIVVVDFGQPKARMEVAS